MSSAVPAGLPGLRFKASSSRGAISSVDEFTHSPLGYLPQAPILNAKCQCFQGAMSYSRPPSRSPSIFRRIANATQVQAILEENDKLRTANAWCKSETEQAHRALWEATAQNSRLQQERDKLEMNVEDITSAWRRTRQSVLTGLEKEKQLQRSIKLRDEQARAYQQELEESQYSNDDLKNQKETVGADCFGSIRS